MYAAWSYGFDHENLWVTCLCLPFDPSFLPGELQTPGSGPFFGESG
jgi:hypothetical protein